MAGAVVGGAVLSAFLQVLFDRLAPHSIVDSISGRKHGQVILVKKLKTTLISAETVLNDAAVKRIVNPSVKEWLEDLQDAAEDGGSLLEKISAEASQGMLGSRASRNKSLEMIIERLEYMMSQKDVLNLKDLGEKLFNGSPTTSLVRESHIYGRDDDVEKMVRLLLVNDVTPDCLRTISIVGVAGIGKTTLAQHVYNDHRVKDSFDLNVWVCLSSESNTWTVTERIFEAVMRTNSGTKDLNQLQLRLKEEVSGKNLLLVLDDVKREDSLEWETLRSPFRFCAGKSLILVTSRSERIAGIMCTLPPYHLTPLSYEYSWAIFTEHALESRYCNADPQLEAIGREIVRKCSGLPGTTKALGIFLCSKADPDEWEKVLKHDLWYSSLDETEILMTLKEETSRGIRKTEQRRIRRSPLQVDSMEHSHQSANRQIKMNVMYLILWIILLSVLSGLLFSVINNAHVMERKKSLGRLCDERAQMLQNQFTFSVNHIDALGMLLARFYYSKNPLDSKQEFFSNYIGTTAVRHPYLSGVAYAERVINAERKEFERDHGWEIKMIQGACQQAPSPARDEYAPVIFATEPVGHIISWDMMSGKEDRKNILKARSAGSLSLSLPFRLLRSHRFGFVLTFPVYTSKLPPNTTLEQRAGATAGYIGAGFEFESFTDNVLSQLDGNQTILITAYDVTNSSESLLMYGGGRYDGSNESLFHEKELKLGDPSRKHKMVCRYHCKAPTSWTAITTSSSFFMIGLLLGCICWGAAFHVLTIREVSHRIRKLEIQAEAANAANSQTPA